MQRRLIPNVTIELGSASGGQFIYRRASESSNPDADDAVEDDDPPGTVEEPVCDPRPPLCKLAPEEE